MARVRMAIVREVEKQLLGRRGSSCFDKTSSDFTCRDDLCPSSRRSGISDTPYSMAKKPLVSEEGYTLMHRFEKNSAHIRIIVFTLNILFSKLGVIYYTIYSQRYVYPELEVHCPVLEYHSPMCNSHYYQPAGCSTPFCNPTTDLCGPTYFKFSLSSVDANSLAI